MGFNDRMKRVQVGAVLYKDYMYILYVVDLCGNLPLGHNWQSCMYRSRKDIYRDTKKNERCMAVSL